MQKAEDQKEVSRGKSLVVSIHDVSPSTRGRTEQILGDLISAGVGRVSLLVIPDHHHRGLISEDPAFSQWLKAECHRGNEAVLHGYYHLRENRKTDGLWTRLIARSYTAGEGEFLDLAKVPARHFLDLGRASLETCGVNVSGFIAPAWLLGEDAEQAVREAGFQYTTRISTVVDFQNQSVHRSRSLVWSVRAGWRRSCSLVWNALLFQSIKRSPLIRVGIHPPDWDHPRIRKQILQILGKALAARRPMTYEGWLTSIRDRP
jgi:predicted deacetylase